MSNPVGIFLYVIRQRRFPFFVMAALTLVYAAAATQAPQKNDFAAYSETIPGSTITFEMVPIPGGTFAMGSPDSEAGRKEDEGPVHKVTLSPFWMGKTEVTWDEYEQYYFTSPTTQSGFSKADAVARPTQPYGAPDLGWGRGKRPAISMTWRAAAGYCEWLTALTGKKYRLPTSAEWEYACRAGSTDPYFFGPDPAKLDENAWFRDNAKLQTHPTGSKKANPWGLYDMLGNVAEFCQDYYSAEDYRRFSSDQWPNDPAGPDKGQERVVRGGSYYTRAPGLRSAARDQTRHNDWLMTDPNDPKSTWWYSDCFFVGFRVVRSQ